MTLVSQDTCVYCQKNPYWTATTDKHGNTRGLCLPCLMAVWSMMQRQPRQYGIAPVTWVLACPNR